MKKDNSINIESTFKEFFSILTANASRSEALKTIAAAGKDRFGEFITPGNLNLVDEVQINFIEILDQIIFELGEERDSGSGAGFYILDDLYSRLSLNLEALTYIDKYLANLKNRPLYYDDLIIVRSRNLAELVPFLISETEDITNLEKQIIKTLLYFPDNTEMNFFYNSFRNSSSGFIKSAALLGMRYSKVNGINWDCIKENANGCSKSIEYIEKFSLEDISENRLPGTMEEMSFALLHAEKIASSINGADTVNWIFSMLDIVPSMNFENSWLNEVNISISNIFLNLNMELVRTVLKDESALVKTVNFIDFLPRNVFNRLTGRLNMLGIEFIFSLNSVIEKRKKHIDVYNSNIITFLSWNSAEML